MFPGVIEHTLLRADAVAEDFLRLVQEAQANQFAGVCVPSSWVGFCRRALTNPSVSVISVVGFPLGHVLTDAKVAETRGAIGAGADEIDVPLNRGFLRDGKVEVVAEDLRAVVEAAGGRPVKVILETCELSREEIATACNLAIEVGAAFVKTSTGFGARGATVEDVAALRAIVGDRAGVKASGGIRTRRFAEALVSAGATRLGTSASCAIIADGAAGSNSD